jgi:predicted thioesterase
MSVISPPRWSAPSVRTTAKVIAVERRVIRFEVAAFEGERKLGEGSTPAG